MQYLLPAMMKTGTKFTLVPQKITKINNIFKNQYSDTEQQAMHDSDLGGQGNKQVIPKHKTLTAQRVYRSLHGEEDPKQPDKRSQTEFRVLEYQGG